MQVHTFLQNSALERQADGCLDFVASQHPDFDASLVEVLDRRLYFILQSIFDRSRSHKHQPLLQLAHDNF